MSSYITQTANTFIICHMHVVLLAFHVLIVTATLLTASRRTAMLITVAPSKCLALIPHYWWLGSVTVRMLDLRLGRCQVVSTWMGDCLRTGKPSRYITNTKVNSAFHPSGVGKSVPACMAGVKARRVHLCWVAGNTVWSHMASDAP